MPSPARYSFSLSLQFGATFWLLGLSLAYLPAWLQFRGLDSVQIGIVLGVAFWGKIPLNLALAQVADRYRSQHRILLAMAVLILLLLPQMSRAHTFAGLLLTWGACGALVAAAIPTTDSLAVLAWRDGAIDYGRTRVWGSGGFVLATAAGGWWLQRHGLQMLPALLLAGAVAMLLGAALLAPPPARGTANDAGGTAIAALLARPGFRRMLLIAALLQSSHAVLYGFASIHWRAAGLSNATIGWLWAEGVVLEIALFAMARSAVARLGWHSLLVLAAAAGIVRWCALAATTSLPALVGLQTLHAATFACTHLGVMSYVARHVEERYTATAQGLYDSVALGLAFGTCMIIAGEAYQWWRGGAFVLMALSSAAALALALRLPRSLRG